MRACTEFEKQGKEGKTDGVICRVTAEKRRTIMDMYRRGHVRRLRRRIGPTGPSCYFGRSIGSLASLGHALRVSTVAACGCSMMRTDHALRVLCYGKDCGFCAMGRTAGSVLWEGLRVCWRRCREYRRGGAELECARVLHSGSPTYIHHWPPSSALCRCSERRAGSTATPGVDN